MDILITNNGEVAAISDTITAIAGGYQLADGAVYPAGLTRLSGVTIPANLAGKRLSYIDEVFAELPALQMESAADLEKRKADLIIRIDTDIDEIITKLIGRRETEYLEAEKQAAAYIAANYTGTVPAFVQSWATAKGQTATWSANDIAATAAAWRTAQTTMRENRLLHKENARNAADTAALNAVATSWAAFLVTIKTQLGLS